MERQRPESIIFAERIEAKNRYFFNVGFNGTKDNVDTWKEFNDLSKRYDGVFITTIRVLLDYLEERKSNEVLLTLHDDLERRCGELELRVAELSEEVQKKEEKKVLKTFGKGE